MPGMGVIRNKRENSSIIIVSSNDKYATACCSVYYTPQYDRVIRYIHRELFTCDRLHSWSQGISESICDQCNHDRKDKSIHQLKCSLQCLAIRNHKQSQWITRDCSEMPGLQEIFNFLKFPCEPLVLCAIHCDHCDHDLIVISIGIFDL